MPENSYRFFTLEYALKEHDFIIRESGGLMGVKNIGMIESVLYQIEHSDLYPEFLDKIVHIVFGLNKNHAFHDGNKRSSIALSAFFLELNGHDNMIKQYTEGMEEVAIWVAKSHINKEQLKQIIEFLLYDDKGNISYFIEQAKRYREYIEEENARINPELLNAMIEDWIGINSLDESNKLKLFEAISC